VSAELDEIVEVLIASYLRKVGATLVLGRDLHPRDDKVVVLRLVVDGEESEHYVDFDPRPGRPFPDITSHDPRPLH
jgi:hypothetical protein